MCIDASIFVGSRLGFLPAVWRQALRRQLLGQACPATVRLIKWQFGFPMIDHNGAMRRVRNPNGIYCQVKGLDASSDLLESAAAESGGWLGAKSGIVLEERLLSCLLPRDSRQWALSRKARSPRSSFTQTGLNLEKPLLLRSRRCPQDQTRTHLGSLQRFVSPVRVAAAIPEPDASAPPRRSPHPAGILQS